MKKILIISLFALVFSVIGVSEADASCYGYGNCNHHYQSSYYPSYQNQNQNQNQYQNQYSYTGNQYQYGSSFTCTYNCGYSSYSNPVTAMPYYPQPTYVAPVYNQNYNYIYPSYSYPNSYQSPYQYSSYSYPTTNYQYSDYSSYSTYPTCDYYC